MANTFKVKTLQSVGTGSATSLFNSGSLVYTVPAATTTVVIGCTISNTTTTAIQGSLFLDNKDGQFVYLVKDAPIPVGGALEVMAGNKVVAETTDKILAKSDSSGSADVTLSIMEIT